MSRPKQQCGINTHKGMRAQSFGMFHYKEWNTTSSKHLTLKRMSGPKQKYGINTYEGWRTNSFLVRIFEQEINEV